MLEPGQQLEQLSVEVDGETPRAYAIASGDHNAIHLDDTAAQALGLPGRIAHGMWTMGMALRLLTQAGIRPERVRATSCRFAKPLPIPAEGSAASVTVTGEVAGVADGVATIAIQVHLGEERLAKLEASVVA